MSLFGHFRVQHEYGTDTDDFSRTPPGDYSIGIH
jgi:hypothetical protein